VDKIASDTMNLVERRINYASAISLEAAMQRAYQADDDMTNILAQHHDISKAAVTLSAVIASTLYPFLYIKAVNADQRIAFWREFVSWKDIPLPLWQFLEAKFPDTHWGWVFLRGPNEKAAGVPDEYRSREIGLTRKPRDQKEEPQLITQTVQEVQCASSASLSTEAATNSTSQQCMSSIQTSAGRPGDVPSANIEANDTVVTVCVYDKSFHESQEVKGAFQVRMKSKNAAPRWRYVCVDCMKWMLDMKIVDQWKELQ